MLTDFHFTKCEEPFPGDYHDRHHDKALFQSLTNHKVALSVLERIGIPDELLKKVRLDCIQRYDTKFVSPELKEFHADVIYQLPFKESEQEGLIFVHFEHQSKPEKLMPLRVWQYLLLLLMDYSKNHPDKPLPLVYPSLIYTGERRYTSSTDLFQLFGEQASLAKEILLKPIELIDVCRLSDEEIKRHGLFGLAEFAFKHKSTPEFDQVLKDFLPWVDEIALQAGEEYVIMLIKYMANIYPNASYKVLVEGVRTYLSEQTGETVMGTIAQELRQSGMEEGFQKGLQQGEQKGLQQGEQKGIKRTILSLLRNGFDRVAIASALGLSLNELMQQIEGASSESA